MNINIDINSGFCFGVVKAIEAAENSLKTRDSLYCLGDIVHNNMEVERLTKMGLIIIDHEKFKTLENVSVLIRAHGEPPETYKIALKNNIELIDASCPVVLRLQNNITKGFNNIQAENGQVVIYGKPGHAEVVGLAGQTLNNAIIISDENDLDKINFNKPISLYSQTTQGIENFNHIVDLIKARLEEINSKEEFIVNDTICREVSHRTPQLSSFAKEHDVVIFVGGKKSSNAKYLFEICKKQNEKTYFVSSREELNKEWFENVENVGICGATSTPRWLMEDIENKIKTF